MPDVPKRQFYSVTHPAFIHDSAHIVFDGGFRRADFISYFAVALVLNKQVQNLDVPRSQRASC